MVLGTKHGHVSDLCTITHLIIRRKTARKVLERKLGMILMTF